MLFTAHKDAAIDYDGTEIKEYNCGEYEKGAVKFSEEQFNELIKEDNNGNHKN